MAPVSISSSEGTLPSASSTGGVISPANASVAPSVNPGSVAFCLSRMARSSSRTRMARSPGSLYVQMHSRHPPGRYVQRHGSVLNLYGPLGRFEQITLLRTEDTQKP